VKKAKPQGSDIMSLIPEFELGLWNAWILILPFLVLSVIGYRILGKRRSGGFSGHTKKEKMLESICMVIIFAFWAYCVFLPLKLGTFWFFAGLFIYLLGMLVVILAMLSFHTTPVDMPVTKGVYRISRHPMYVGEILIDISIGIACLSWIFLLLAIVEVILESYIVTAEERICLNQYGDAYKEYMNRTPRWIGVPKSRKKPL
jgi:protein-S-isoprenylcysteine O-methyltransferase Ste14